MALNWINVEEFNFTCLSLMERFQIRLLCDIANDEFRPRLALALKRNPAVAWALCARCPEREEYIAALVKSAPECMAPEEIRAAEVCVIAQIEDFVLYTKPELMDSHCDFIYAWDKSRLFELADFEGKRVLDVGSGSGRLAFAAAERASEVYASEPVSMLREYLRDKIAREGIRNVRVVDGMAHSLPYPDDTFDIVMSGHVVGDDTDNELKELCRVTKSGGWLLDCPGEDPRKRKPDAVMEAKGFERMYYVSKLGGDVYRYRKQIIKPIA